MDDDGTHSQWRDADTLSRVLMMAAVSADKQM